MKKLLFALMATAMLASGHQMQAKSLTADEALALAAQRQLRIGANASNTNLQLAYTYLSPVTGLNAAYVFAKPQAEGFAILAADDVVGDIVLAYSNDSQFDADNIPPALQWWLSLYSASIEYLLDQEASSTQRLRRAAQQRNVIAPLVSTKWNQGDPYNALCPELPYESGTSKAVTGCVATAMAQVAKAHNWPPQGVGTHSYSYDYNGTTRNVSLNLSQYTYNWDRMLDEYTETNSTFEQRLAVAQLMVSCGVVANMAYTPVESGANDIDAALGMVEHMQYDKGMRYLERAWFTQEEWNDLIYAELEAGRPVLYGGYKLGGGGHEFVCDGYGGDEYFHINWGWGGMSDGYFLLPLLLPANEGIGGASGQSGYSVDQSILANIKPAEEGSDFVPMMAIKNKFETDATTYTRQYGYSIQFSGGFYSYAIQEMEYQWGFHFVGDNIDQYLTLGTKSFKPQNGYYSFGIPTMNFPVGEYYVIPAFKTADTEWQEMAYNKDHYSNSLYFNVTSSQISVTNPTITTQLNATLEGLYANGYNDDSFIAGHTYEATYGITTNGAWSGQLLAVLLNPSTNYIVATGDSRLAIYNGKTSTSETFSFKIPSTLETGTYVLALASYINGYNFVSDGIEIDVTKITPSGKGTATLYNWNGGVGVGTQSRPIILQAGDPFIVFKVECTEAPWVENVYTYFGEGSWLTWKGETQTINLQNVGDTDYLVFSKLPPDNEYNHTYVFELFGDTNTHLTYAYSYQIANKTTLTDGEPYYNCQDFNNIDVDYVRNFNNTAWQPLYVPFDMAYEEWAGKAEVAEFSNVLTYDDDKNGTIDRYVLEFLTIKSGKLSPNTPYLIKSETADEVTFSCTGKTLKAAPKSEGNINCASTSYRFDLNGIYTAKSDFNNDPSLYVMSGGTFYHTTGTLKPFRFYVRKTERTSGGYLGATSSETAEDQIYVQVDGEICGTLSAINDADEADDTLYDLQGRAIANPTPGIYVRSGKKVIIK